MSVGERVRAVVETWLEGRGSQVVGEEVLGDLLADLEDAAMRAVAHSNLHPEAEPLTLTKARVGQMLACERHMLAMLRGDSRSMKPGLVMGTLLDVLTSHRVTTGRLDGPPLDLALKLLDGGTDNADKSEWVRSLDQGLRAAFAEDLHDRRNELLGDWPTLESVWWPRVQERALLVLAEGRIVVDSKLDVIIGGPPTNRRALIIETKLGKLRREDLDDGLLYALLVALRDSVPPDCVVTCSAENSTVQEVWIGEAELRSASLRLANALERAGELAGGRVPVEHASPRCGWCPDAGACPSKMSPADLTTQGEFEESSAEEDPADDLF